MVAMYFLKPEIIFNLILKFLQSGLREKRPGREIKMGRLRKRE